MGTLIRHPRTIAAQRKKLEHRKLLVEQLLKDTPEGSEIYSKLLSESLWLHGVISALDWALGTGKIDGLFDDLIAEDPMQPPAVTVIQEDLHETKPSPSGGDVRPPDGPEPGAIVQE